MKSFIPNIEDPPDSDDSDAGIFLNANILAQSDIEDTDSDTPGDDDMEDGQNNDDDSDAEINGADDLSDSDISESSEEAEATLQEIFGVKPSLESQRIHPPDFSADSGIVDICFHPNVEILAAATMDGEVVMYKYSDESVEEQTRYPHHRKPCRAVCFNEDGTLLFTVSKDKSLAVVDTETSDLKYHIKDAHDAGIYSFASIDEHLCATGDDDGTVKIWDFRRSTSIFDFKCGEQTVTSLCTDDRKKTLAASVNDGSIAGFNIRGKRLEAQSEMYDSELTSLCLVRSDTRLLVGSGEGAFIIFNWGEFGSHIDRFSGHPDEIHCIVPISDKLVLTGCEDGIIRAVHLYPHRFVGVVGQHKSFGVENMSISSDGRFLTSCSMDETVRFWNIDYLYDVEVDERKKSNKKIDQEKNLESSKRRNRSDFFEDFPAVVESDDDENGPVAGPSNIE